jgi:hypothetical protein
MAWFDIPKAMRAKLLANTTLQSEVGQRIHYQEIPQASEWPHVWFTRTSRNEDDALEGGHLVTERFAIEIASNTDSEAIIDAIFAELSEWRGDVSGKDIQLVDVEDADDDYIFRSIGEGEPTFLHALQVVVYWV